MIQWLPNEILIACFAFLVIVLPKLSEKFKFNLSRSLIMVGVIVLLLSINQHYGNEKAKQTSNDTIASLKNNTVIIISKLDSVSNDRKIDSTNMADFEKTLKDSLGIIRIINTNKPQTTSKFIQYINQFYIKNNYVSPPTSLPNARRVNNTDIDSLNTIPNDYNIAITLDSSHIESISYATEIRNELISLGHNKARIFISSSGLDGIEATPRFNLSKSKSIKRADITIGILPN
jgi:hypothetical protein